jgi:hypothetical protein
MHRLCPLKYWILKASSLLVAGHCWAFKSWNCSPPQKHTFSTLYNVNYEIKTVWKRIKFSIRRRSVTFKQQNLLTKLSDKFKSYFAWHILWQFCEFFMYLPFTLHNRHVKCYVHRSQRYSVSSDLDSHALYHFSKQFTTQHINVTLLAETQLGVYLLLQRSRGTAVVFLGGPMLWMLYLQST